MKEPKIRFNEFKGEWEETTFGRISSNYKYGINAAAIPFDGTNKYLRITDIDEESRMFSQQDLTSPNANLSLCNDYLLEDGDITIARTGASVGKSYIYHEKDGKVYFAGFLIRIRLNNYIDKECVYNITLTDNYSKHIRLVSQRSGQPGVNINELKDFRFFLPVDFQEQHSIASFFTTLDAQISASTSRLASLKQIKAASLQAMFPQEGETVPKLRFKGFEGEWEKVAIKDIATFSKGRGYSKSDLRVVGTPIILYGRMYTKYEACITNVDTFVNPLPNSIYSLGNEVIMPASGETPEDISCASAIQVRGIILGGDLNVLHFNIDCYDTTFIALSLSIGKIKKDLSNMAQGKSVVHLHNSDIEKIDMFIPSFAEQRAIASFFTNLDRQITLQSQRLEKLKQIKAACLDKMFV